MLVVHNPVCYLKEASPSPASSDSIVLLCQLVIRFKNVRRSLQEATVDDPCDDYLREGKA